MSKIRVIELSGEYPRNVFGASSIVYRKDQLDILFGEIKDQLYEESDLGDEWTLTVREMDEKENEALPELD